MDFSVPSTALGHPRMKTFLDPPSHKTRLKRKEKKKKKGRGREGGGEEGLKVCIVLLQVRLHFGTVLSSCMVDMLFNGMV